MPKESLVPLGGHEAMKTNVLHIQFPDGEIRLLHMEGTPALGETVVYDEPRAYAGRYVVADVEWRFSGGVGEAAFSRRIVILVAVRVALVATSLSPRTEIAMGELGGAISGQYAAIFTAARALEILHRRLGALDHSSS